MSAETPGTRESPVIGRSVRGWTARGTWWAPLCVFLLVVVAWQGSVVFWKISPLLLPSPILSQIKSDAWPQWMIDGTRELPKTSVAWSLWNMRSDLSSASARTALAALSGLAISTVAGTLLSFLFSQSTIVRLALFPYAVLLQTVPIIAIAPIIIIGFGRGFFSIALVAAIISVFPIITNTTTGLLQIDQNLRDLFRLYEATRLQTLLKLRIPSSLPFLFAGVRIACGSAIVGAIVGEFFVGSGQPGLGAMIQKKSATLDTADLYAAVLTSAFLGTAVFSAVSAMSNSLLRRWFGHSAL